MFGYFECSCFHDLTILDPILTPFLCIFVGSLTPNAARRGMMEDMERYYDIKKGTIPQHDNLLAISKPEDEMGHTAKDYP